MPQNTCLLAIDLGSTTCRCLAISLQGEMLAEASQETTLIYEQPSYAEADPDQWWQSTCDVIRQVMQALPSGVAPAALSLTGLQHAMTPIDAQGKALDRAMLWMDQRCEPQVNRINAQHRDVLQSVSGPQARMTATPSLAKLLWLAENRPQVVERTWHFLLPKDLIRYRLTGTIGTDPSDAGGSGMFDRRKNCWSPELVSLAGINIEQLAPILPSDSVAGTVTGEAAASSGLPEGLPVVVGMGDVGATVLGMGGEPTQGVLLYLGTAAWFRAVYDDGHRKMAATATTGAAVRWLRGLWGGSYDNLVDLAKQSAPGAEGLLFLPHLCGERSPYYRADVTASLLGLSLRHGREQISQALLEGCALHLRWLMHDPTRPQLQQALAAGGGAKSGHWLQTIANVLQMDVGTLQVPEAGSLGAAILAAVGAGLYRDKEEAQAHMVHMGTCYQPDKLLAPIYDDAYQRYVAAEALLGPSDY